MPAEESCTDLNNNICKLREVLPFSWLSLRAGKVHRPCSSLYGFLHRLAVFVFSGAVLFYLQGSLSQSSWAHLLFLLQGHHPTPCSCFPCFWFKPLTWIFATSGIKGVPPLLPRWGRKVVCMWLPDNFQDLLLFVPWHRNPLLPCFPNI